MAGVKRALISVSDKSGIVEFARELSGLGVEILSTGGTARALKDAGIPVKDVSEHTGFPEMMDGRLKTLHPKVHGGLLWRRDNSKDREEVEKHNIESIDMVVVNLYPFEQTVSKPDVKFDVAIENIDIGGPTMLRAASKNFKDVIVIVDPDDYSKVLDEMKSNNNEAGYDTKYYLARKVFSHTARYDTLISTYLNREAEPDDIFPPTLNMSYSRISSLRYGENPHMKAAVYREPLHKGLSLVDAKILQGREMSFNNYLDSSAVIDLAKEFKGQPAAVIVKHNNPCGVSLADSLHKAYKQAFETDPISAFGGVISLNENVDEATAKEILNLFVEIIIAPGFDPDALKLLAAKPNIRLIELDITKDATGFEMRKIQGGLLVQEKDTGMIEDMKSLKVVTKRKPTDDEYAAMAFAWRVCKHMKSNAIIYASGDRTLGIGCGQTSRVDSARLAAMKAENYNISLNNSAAASDAFFPNRDGIDVIAKAGATAVIQPGGSIKDSDTIAAADEHNMAMVFSGMRHFRH
ncbi:bifunctional purine biosynthesis protein PurH [bacterium BMS3Abin10]|nr:bifunctional purine biosynthesis protein PurH [bacterium BMS3Abin10]GBE39886.1 bifunctional purine biosynthesis protein PurH [bacterium BMS3Bbin08]HDH50395.1 bifunctional phosphoribosylaminoimidazolecarboxamide formyltransferase/IMP cyclohydrolase [Nitrospirota bacterium]